MKNTTVVKTQKQLQNQTEAIRQSKNILVVCDDITKECPLKEMLEPLGYRVFLFSKQGKKFHVAIDLFAIDIIIISIDETHWQKSVRFGKLIRRSDNIPHIYVSTSDQVDLFSKAQKSLPYGYHVYPIDPINLHASIECSLFCFEKHRERDTSMKQIRHEYHVLKNKAFGVTGNRSHIRICECFSFHLKEYTLLYQNHKIKLTKHEKKLITLLVSHIGNNVDFDAIINYVWGNDLRVEWGGEMPTHNDVRTLVWRLNKKLPLSLVKNSSGIGYYLGE